MLTHLTTIISDSKTQQRVNRANLLGHLLRRDLSYLLVITLLLLSAVSFSTEKIPNFKPDCETTSVQKSTKASPVAVIRSHSLSKTKNNTSVIVTPLALSTPRIPVIELFSLPVASRAPPIIFCTSVFGSMFLKSYVRRQFKVHV